MYELFPVLTSIVYICIEVLRNYPGDVDPKTSIVTRALVSCVLSPSKAVRSAALEGMRRTLLCRHEAAPLARALVLQVAINLEGGKQQQQQTNGTENGVDGCQSDVLGKAIIEAITTICSYKGNLFILINSSK